MQQKIQFIATIIHDPSLIILDEPFSGFDPINVNIIKDEILELKKNGATIIFSTHRMESVEELCDHIALINKSNVILDGSKHDIKQKHRTNTFIVDYKIQMSTFRSLIKQKRMKDIFAQQLKSLMNCLQTICYHS
jgi:ABC-2 type transport system ATP-binding protein